MGEEIMHELTDASGRDHLVHACERLLDCDLKFGCSLKAVLRALRNGATHEIFQRGNDLKSRLSLEQQLADERRLLVNDGAHRVEFALTLKRVSAAQNLI